MDLKLNRIRLKRLAAWGRFKLLRQTPEAYAALRWLCIWDAAYHAYQQARVDKMAISMVMQDLGMVK